MKPKIAIMTDSSTSIYATKHNFDNLFMVDIPCFIGDLIFTNFESNGDGPFYQAYQKATVVPKTSQPSVGETLSKFELIKSLGYTHIIYLPISKELSGTYQNGFLAKDMIEGIEIEIVDTLTTVSILSRMALDTAKLAKEGASIEDIKARIERIKNNWGYYLTVEDLTPLVKNGRLSNAKSFVANLLKIKPVIKFNREGKLVALENVRTYKGAIRSVVDKILNEVDPNKGEIHIAYATNIEDVNYVKSLIFDKYPNINIQVYSLPATIVAHVGLAAVGVGYVNN